MGTNYYVMPEKPCCLECGREFDKLHIGKSSAGWHFSLRVYPENGINNLQDWIKFLEFKKIYNEYGEMVSLEDFLEVITNRKASRKPTREDFGRYAEEGLNNLLRYKIDNDFCISHGDGTYDYIIGDFS